MSNEEQMPFSELISDLYHWSNSQNQKYFIQKVERVFFKCIRSGRIELARKIKDKYKDIPTTKSDLSISMAYALMAYKKS